MSIRGERHVFCIITTCLWFWFQVGTALLTCTASLEARNGLEQRGCDCFQSVPTQGTCPDQTLCQSLHCGEPDYCTLLP